MSTFPHLVDACIPGGCAIDPVCGNGIVEPGETCDAPDGATCDENCQLTSCPDEGPGTLIACSSGSLSLALDGIGDVFLAAFGGRSASGEGLVRARRFAADASWLDSQPIDVSEAPGEETPASFWVSGSTHDGNVFQVGMEGRRSVVPGISAELFHSREIPITGPPATEVRVISTNLPFGMCRMSTQGPLALAPYLAGGEFHAAYRQVYGCAGEGVLFETLVGVPGDFSVPPNSPPAHVSEGGAALARGGSNVAGAWFDVLVDSLAPPTFFTSIAVGWVEPGPAEVILLAAIDGAKSGSPALTAAGEVFLAVWAVAADPGDAAPTELRAARFSRAAGALDAPGGFLLASGGGALGQPKVDSDGTTFSVAWVEDQGSAKVLHALRVGADGVPVDPAPLDLVSSEELGAIDIASTPSGTFVAYSRAESAGAVSVRGVRLPD